MVRRPFWLGRLEDAWRARSVVWLMGVRRAGKTVLARSIAGAEYFDCELPSTRRMLTDPESFLADHSGRTIVTRRGESPMAIECKWSADHFEPASLRAFRNHTRPA